jgi:hypothetical protein
MSYNFTPKLISGNIYDCPFYLHCPNRLCEIEGGIEERCLILERASFNNKSEMKEEIQENFGEYWEFFFN